jgi:DNA-binding transcriptional ArsR family regulator
MQIRNVPCRRRSEYVELAVEVFSMLADATRIRIILALRDQELSVNHLADIVDKSAPAVSQHLAKLAWRGSCWPGGHEGVLPARERARPQLVADAIFQAQHTLSNDPAHHRGTARGGARCCAVLRNAPTRSSPRR